MPDVARLKYNNAVGTLGGSLTNNGNTITFATAPSFATLGGSDYIPLVLEPASGNTPSANFEIVHLTAYTSGATTGTISRGQEGTTGVAHNNGVTWVCAPVTNDVVDYPTETDARYLQLGAAAGGDLSGTYPNPIVANLNSVPADAVTTKGDILAANSTPALKRLGVGSNSDGYLLTARSTATLGVDWEAPSRMAITPSNDNTGVTDDANYWKAYTNIYNRGGSGEILLVPNGNPFYTVAGWALPQNRPIGTVTATTTSASTSVTSIVSGSTSLSASTTYFVFGPGIPAGAKLTTGGSPTSGTLSVNAVAGSGAGTTLFVGDTTFTTGDPICLAGAGIARVCPIAGTAIGIWSHRTATYSTQGNMLAQRWVGYIRDIVVDGQFATGNAIGVHIGDGWGYDIRMRAINFSDVGSGGSGTGGCNPYTSISSPGGIGFYFTRTLGTTFWTEKNRIFELSSSNNATAVFITSAIASGGNGISDEYNVYDINMWCNSGQQGIVAQYVNMGGSRIYVRGNMSRSNNLVGTFTGNTTNGSTSVTSITGGTITANLTNGQTTMGSPANGTFNVPNSGTYQVSGTGIPASTTATFVSGVGTLSANATATNTGVTITLMPTNGTAFTLTGAGIPAGATLSMTSATAGTLSANATATGTGVTLVPSPTNNVAMLSFVNGARLYLGWLQVKIESGSADAPWTVYCDGNTSGSGSNAGLTQCSGHLGTSLFGSNMNGQNFQLNGLITNGDLPGVQGGGGVGSILWPSPSSSFDSISFPGGQLLHNGGNPPSNSLWKNYGPAAQVTISGGAYTQVTLNNVAMLNGTSISSPSSFVVPPGGSLKVTYTTAPTIMVTPAMGSQYSP